MKTIKKFNKTKSRFNNNDRRLKTNVKWKLKSDKTIIFESSSFPYTFGEAIRIINIKIAAGENIENFKDKLAIIGPTNGKGEPMIYTYAKARSLAEAMDLLTPEGLINKKAMKCDNMILGIHKPTPQELLASLELAKKKQNKLDIKLGH